MEIRRGIGKTTFAKQLYKEDIVHTISSFALPIKEQAYEIYSKNNNMSSKISLDDFIQNKKDIIIPGLELTPRELTIKYSDYIQSIFGSDVWATYGYYTTVQRQAYKKIMSASDDVNTFIAVFDDWRRIIESNYLQEIESVEKVIKVYLTKEDVKASVLTTIGNTYQGQISEEDCDIVFEFDKYWSNSSDLIKIIEAELNN